MAASAYESGRNLPKKGPTFASLLTPPEPPPSAPNKKMEPVKTQQPTGIYLQHKQLPEGPPQFFTGRATYILLQPKTSAGKGQRIFSVAGTSAGRATRVFLRPGARSTGVFQQPAACRKGFLKQPTASRGEIRRFGDGNKRSKQRKAEDGGDGGK